MRKNKLIILAVVLIVVIAALWLILKKSPDQSLYRTTEITHQQVSNDSLIAYTVDIKQQTLRLYWKNDDSKILGSIKNLKTWLSAKNQSLLFATNGGMFKKDQSPQGLFIQDGITKAALDTANGNGNFYLQPNGVFYLTQDSTANICSTPDFINTYKIKYATQSGPMLVIDGKIHPAFKEGSTNLNIRNGVGILPDGNIVFAMSKTEINFYNFALFFKKLGCKNALYLDGFVSRTYLPEKKWIQEDGNFGVIIGVTAKAE